MFIGKQGNAGWGIGDFFVHNLSLNDGEMKALLLQSHIKHSLELADIMFFQLLGTTGPGAGVGDLGWQIAPVFS